MPKDWNDSIICPIYKKGDKNDNDCGNYRGIRISLLKIAYKILASVMCERLKPHVIRIIGSYQCGFMPGRSTSDQIFTLRQILEKTREFEIDTHTISLSILSKHMIPKKDMSYSRLWTDLASHQSSLNYVKWPLITLGVALKQLERLPTSFVLLKGSDGSMHYHE